MLSWGTFQWCFFHRNSYLPEFHFALVLILIEWLLPNFAHAMTAVLSWHVQNFVAVILLWMEVQQNKISIENWIKNENYLWNERLAVKVMVMRIRQLILKDDPLYWIDLGNLLPRLNGGCVMWIEIRDRWTNRFDYEWVVWWFWFIRAYLYNIRGYLGVFDWLSSATRSDMGLRMGVLLRKEG